jgi:methionyl-tRNA formyltransferase
MKIALFANDNFGSYVFDVLAGPEDEIVCVVGQTRSFRGRAFRKLLRISKRPGNAWKIAKGLLRQTPQLPRRGRARISRANLEEICQARSIPLFEDYHIHFDSFPTKLAEFAPDLIVVATFGVKVPTTILCIPPLGVINVHFALLPRYRGANPELCCLLNGEPETGVTIHFMDESFDTGDIIAQEKVTIDAKDTYALLQDKLYPVARDLLQRVLKNFASGPVAARPQEQAKATYCNLRNGFDEIDWNARSGLEIRNLIRACTSSRHVPWCRLGRDRLYLVDALFEERDSREAGTVREAEDGFTISCEGGAVLVSEVYYGGKCMKATEFLGLGLVQSGRRLV